MLEIISIIGYIGFYTIWITPFTLITGIIYAIKKPEKEATPYKNAAIVSAYLIIASFLYLLINKS
jgi:hypothetical protein